MKGIFECFAHKHVADFELNSKLQLGASSISSLEGDVVSYLTRTVAK